MRFLKKLTYRFYYFLFKTLGSVDHDPHQMGPPMQMTITNRLWPFGSIHLI
ncbi:hypothetical protein HanHA89_Chr10g0402191 [Helianthus annuus]|nr:hypothetical protein HanHA89_Chr10g0402191 [Helianthus annuus]